MFSSGPRVGSSKLLDSFLGTVGQSTKIFRPSFEGDGQGDALSSAGSMALHPAAAKAYDMICLVCGARIPFVVREVGGCHSLIGGLLRR